MFFSLKFFTFMFVYLLKKLIKIINKTYNFIEVFALKRNQVKNKDFTFLFN